MRMPTCLCYVHMCTPLFSPNSFLTRFRLAFYVFLFWFLLLFVVFLLVLFPLAKVVAISLAPCASMNGKASTSALGEGQHAIWGNKIKKRDRVREL